MEILFSHNVRICFPDATDCCHWRMVPSEFRQRFTALLWVLLTHDAYLLINAYYLVNAQELLDDSASEWGSKDAYDDEEKVEFPSGRPLPTFSAAFGNDVPPSQMRFGPPRLGPRFNNPSLEPFDPQPPMDSGISDHLTTYSKSSVTTTNSSASHSNEPLAIAEWKDHARSASVGSQKSYSSYKSSSSQRSHNSSRSAQLYGSAVGPDRRWMIE